MSQQLCGVSESVDASVTSALCLNPRYASVIAGLIFSALFLRNHDFDSHQCSMVDGSDTTIPTSLVVENLKHQELEGESF